MPDGARPGAPRRVVAEGLAVAALLSVFALTIRTGWPLVLLAALALALAGLAIGQAIGRARTPLLVLGIARPDRRVVIMSAIGCALGCVLGMGLRWASDASIFPAAPGAFVLVAAAIGAAEELVYRGYVQGRFAAFGAFPAAAFAALCHAGYKCALFAIPSASDPATGVDLVLLASGTFLGGLAFGALKESARNVLPAVAAHVCFDIVVYGGLSTAPWWVWP